MHAEVKFVINGFFRLVYSTAIRILKEFIEKFNEFSPIIGLIDNLNKPSFLIC